MTTQQKITEAEQALQEWNVAYTKQDDGTIVVEGDINISNKSLTKLPDLSKVIIKRNFLCNGNQLISLSGAPASVGGSFLCNNNQLTSLEGAPQKFKTLHCDFGDFTSWDEVPEYLRISPETKEKEKQERLEKLNRIGAAATQRQTFKPMPSIRFKAGPK